MHPSIAHLATILAIADQAVRPAVAAALRELAPGYQDWMLTLQMRGDASNRGVARTADGGARAARPASGSASAPAPGEPGRGRP